MEVALSRPQMISLAAGFTDNESLPVAEAWDLLSDIFEVAQDRPACAAIRHDRR